MQMRRWLNIVLLSMGISLAWNTQTTFAQTPVCQDRPLADHATPPDTVWVEVDIHYEEAGSPRPFARSFTFDNYVTGVLIGELGPNPAASEAPGQANPHLPDNNNAWEDTTLKAMAVAIRSFAWYRYNYAGQYLHETTLVTPHQCAFYDTTPQVFRPFSRDVEPEVRTHYGNIVTPTVANTYLVYGNGQNPIEAQYRSTGGELSQDVAQWDYLESIYDPVSHQDVGSGIGLGSGARNAGRWA